MTHPADHTLLAAKLAPPPALSGLVRTQTQAKLRAACRPGTVVAVQAPAGFGKTIALKSLYESLDDAAWITLDSADSCWALRRYARAALDALGPRGTLIAAGLGAMPAAQEALECLLEMIGPEQTLVVGSSARIAHEGAVRINSEDMRLDRGEVAALCTSDEQADVVWDLARGWPEISMMLARSGVAAPGEPVPDKLLDAIAAFCEEEVISRLDPELAYLLGMVVLLPAPEPRIAAGLVRADDGAIAQLAEETPFFMVDEEGAERFVPIFQQVARRRRPAVGDLPSKEFLIQASSLYAKSGQHEYAAWCAILAGSYRRAAAHILSAADGASKGLSCAPGERVELLARAIALADGMDGGSLPQALAPLAGKAEGWAELDALVSYCSAVGDDPAFGGVFKRLGAALSELAAAAPARQADVPAAAEAPAEAPALTPAEIRVMEMLAQGRSARQIAADTNTSEATVRTHTKRAYRKLGAHGRKQAVSAALSLGLISID